MIVDGLGRCPVALIFSPTLAVEAPKSDQRETGKVPRVRRELLRLQSESLINILLAGAKRGRRERLYSGLGNHT